MDSMKNILAVILVLLVSVIPTAATVGCGNNSVEGNVMTVKGTIPLIDMNQPAEVAQATFSLG